MATGPHHNQLCSSWSSPHFHRDEPRQTEMGIDMRPQAMHRSATAPATHPAHPCAVILSDEVPKTTHGPDLLFTNATRITIANDIRHVHFSPPPPPPPPVPAKLHHPPIYTVSPPPLPPPPSPPPSSSVPHPSIHLHRSLTSPPPVPPKPPLSRHVTSPPPRTSPNCSVPPPTLPTNLVIPHREEPSPDSTDDEGDLAMALALSQSESQEEEQLQAQLRNQEEEDLARALEASMLSASTDFREYEAHGDNAIAGSSEDVLYRNYISQLFVHSSVASPSGTTNLESRHNSKLHNLSSSDAEISRDEAFARMLAAEEEENGSSMIRTDTKASQNEYESSPSDKVADHPVYPSPGDYTVDGGATTMASGDKGVISDDEAYARWLALEGDQESVPTTITNSKEAHPLPDATSPVLQPPDLKECIRNHIKSDIQLSKSSLSPPLDDEKCIRRLVAEEEAGTAVTTAHQTNDDDRTSTVGPNFVASLTADSPAVQTEELPAYSDSRSPPYKPSASHSTIKPSVVIWGSSPNTAETPAVETSPQTGSSQLSTSPSVTATSSSDLPHLLPQKCFLQPPGNLVRVSPATSLSKLYATESNSNPLPSPNPSVVNLNHFVDTELFHGVSVGFSAPVLSAQLVPMQSIMPNVISLPYGRCPPLHIHGPSWRHLLKLMARLSGTRLEPTPEALVVAKSSLKLRTVVQFVKVHHSSPDWRTILWFTIDRPVPPIIPHAYRYSSTNVNVLPWSYTLSDLPALLRDAADTPISKAYTIPASDAIPYPELPISFPNLATYLQAALDDSRRYLGDSTGGLRKLAKMVQTCYPSNQEDSLLDAPERSGVGDLFKRVMGRSSKSSKKGKGGGGGGNEDTYELVTPFVPDEWG